MKRYLIIVLVLFTTVLSNAQNDASEFTNPIIPGFHPDPSICRVNDDYYLVTSSFEWFPGLPIYHSKDLVNWELIGHGIHRPTQLPKLSTVNDSKGTYAPTIRYNEGVYYIINTCVGCKGNYYITATSPEGPWSDPVWLNAPQIDPSLFWDDDGTCYYIGNGKISGKKDWFAQRGAWIQKLDLEQGKLVGERLQLTYGHASDARWTEAPHIYKVDSTYILLVGEGGTNYHHSVTAFHSDKIWKAFTPCQTNPVLTHRHLGTEFPVQAVGHADLVQTQNGEWWSVMLAKRKKEGAIMLARETFLAKVEFQNHDGELTPVYNPGEGRLLEKQTRPDLPWTPVKPLPGTYDFNDEELGLEWNYLRNPETKWHDTKDGKLYLNLRPETTETFCNPSYLARRVQNHEFSASVKLIFDSKKENEMAGLLLYRKTKKQIHLLKQGNYLVLEAIIEGKKVELGREKYTKSSAVLRIEADNIKAQFSFGESKDKMKKIGGIQDISFLGDDGATDFNGLYIGMYATSNGIESENKAAFDWFTYSE